MERGRVTYECLESFVESRIEEELEELGDLSKAAGGKGGGVIALE